MLLEVQFQIVFALKGREGNFAFVEAILLATAGLEVGDSGGDSC